MDRCGVHENEKKKENEQMYWPSKFRFTESIKNKVRFKKNETFDFIVAFCEDDLADIL